MMDNYTRAENRIARLEKYVFGAEKPILQIVNTELMQQKEMLQQQILNVS